MVITVQQESMAFPADSRLYYKMLMHLVKMLGARIVLRQSYVRSLILLGGFCGSRAMPGIRL